MQAALKQHLSSPWMAVTLAVAVISLVYVTTLTKQAGALSVDEATCPVECTGEDCPHSNQH